MSKISGLVSWLCLFGKLQESKRGKTCAVKALLAKHRDIGVKIVRLDTLMQRSVAPETALLGSKGLQSTLHTCSMGSKHHYCFSIFNCQIAQS